MLKQGEQRRLVEERMLQNYIDGRRSHRNGERIYAYHPYATMDEVLEDPTTWMPQAYIDLMRMAAPSGKVLAVGKVTKREIYEGGGYYGTESRAQVTVSLSSRDGAFPGTSMCKPGRPLRWKLEAVTDVQATLTWSWYAEQDMPAEGMKVTTECP
jgi:hypothetical protein